MATLRDLLSNAHPQAGRAVRTKHVADIESDDLGEAEAGTEGDRKDDVVADVAGRRTED
jgi:hypothetical protein